MMIHPSYSEIMSALNEDPEDDRETTDNSRYSVVMATAKRAREIVDGSMPLVETTEKEKPLSIAVEELYEGKVSIVDDDENPDTDENADAAEAENEDAEA